MTQAGRQEGIDMEMEVETWIWIGGEMKKE